MGGIPEATGSAWAVNSWWGRLNAGRQTGKNEDSQDGAKKTVKSFHGKFRAEVSEERLDPIGE
jgi:hypothetical protein